MPFNIWKVSIIYVLLNIIQLDYIIQLCLILYNFNTDEII